VSVTGVVEESDLLLQTGGCHVPFFFWSQLGAAGDIHFRHSHFLLLDFELIWQGQKRS
jgi:hypothetical protein